jgi:hypothetical protein
MPTGKGDLLVGECQRLAGLIRPQSPEVEAYLAGYLLVALVAQYEASIIWIFTSRASKRNDQRSERFVHRVVSRTVRSLLTSELGTTLGQFDDACKARFRELLETRREDETRFNNMIENRNLFSHGDGINMTLPEVVASHQSSRFVLECLSNALNA